MEQMLLTERTTDFKLSLASALIQQSVRLEISLLLTVKDDVYFPRIPPPALNQSPISPSPDL